MRSAGTVNPHIFLRPQLTALKPGKIKEKRDDVFKVGMTRRLEPQERIDELRDASVPFPFDVHSFIFSENAVQLESTMYKRLHECRLNKVNLRKEFFKASLNELESLVGELEPSAEFKRTMLAEQFYQSQSMEHLE